MKEFTIYVNTVERNSYKFHIDAETEAEAKEIASGFEVDYAKCYEDSCDVEGVYTEKELGLDKLYEKRNEK